MSGAAPTRIELFPNGEVGIVWPDGTESIRTARDLRITCPCAGCVDELTGIRRLDPDRIPDAIRVTTWAWVGRYAVQFRWTDGHDTGLFSFDYLRAVTGA